MRTPRTWSSVLFSACLILLTFPLAQAQPRRATADSGAPSGLVVVRSIRNSPQLDRDLNERALGNPFISGVAYQIHWSDIEAVEGKPDWSKLDALFAAAASSKKWVQLLVYPGFFAPAWALEGAKAQQFPAQYGPEKGKLLALPLPWDDVYLQRWFTFLKQLSERYGGAPAFKVIAAAGPTSVTSEMTLPQSAADLKEWQRDGYTASKFVGAWRKVFEAYAAAFPHQYISLTVGDALNLNEQGRMAPGEGNRVRQAIITQAMDLLGHRFLLENDDLHAGQNHQSPATSFVMSYSGRVTTGLEATCAAENCSPEMGAPGDPVLALRRTIDAGMVRNQAGAHVSYLEIYEPDVLADEMQPVLRYAASLFAGS